MRYLAYFSHGDHLGTRYMNTTFCCMVRHGIFKGSYENKHESVFWFGTQSCRVFFHSILPATKSFKGVSFQYLYYGALF